MIVVTGSSGLIGRSLVRELTLRGHSVLPFDVRDNRLCDTRKFATVLPTIEHVSGVVHLAAISRVVWAELHPKLSDEVNVEASFRLVEFVASRSEKPWLIFGSSREVYGERGTAPTREDVLPAPMNHYARGKLAVEQMIADANSPAFIGNICRFSNVYGCADDHRDRVCMAFARAAAFGGEIRLEGGKNLFDFTHVRDVTRGLVRLVELTSRGVRLDPIHLVSGVGTNLEELAEIALLEARSPISVRLEPPRSFDVSAFVGDPQRAKEILDWTAEIPIQLGMASLVSEISRKGPGSGAGSWIDLVENDQESVNNSGQ
jgi:nucleoside-diphosphate-sugar epimerase